MTFIAEDEHHRIHPLCSKSVNSQIRGPRGLPGSALGTISGRRSMQATGPGLVTPLLLALSSLCSHFLTPPSDGVHRQRKPIAITISVTRRTVLLGGRALAGGSTGGEGFDALCSSAMASSLAAVPTPRFPRSSAASCLVRGRRNDPERTQSKNHQLHSNRDQQDPEHDFRDRQADGVQAL